VSDSLLVTSPGLIDVIAGVLAENGPMTEDQLIATLSGRGVDLGDDPEEALAEALGDGDGLVAVLADERWASLPALLVGRVFTRQLTGPEVEHDILDVNSDLEPVEMLTEREEYQRLTDGSPVVGVLMPFDVDTLAERGVPLDVVGDHGALLLPPGYLRGRGLGEGDVIALGLAADGLVLESVPQPVVTAETVATLGRRLNAVLGENPDEPTPLDIAVWTACADDPTLFTRPLPPLGAALDACGLAHDGEWLATEGFDIRRWQVEQRCAAVARVHGLSGDEALAVLAMVTLYDQVVELHAAALTAQEDRGEAALAAFITELTNPPELSPTSPDSDHSETRMRTAIVRTTTAFLAEPAVAKAVLAGTIGADREGAAALGLFAETLEPQALPTARPALRWLRGKAHERLGDPTQAEAAYLAAESLDPQWSPVLVDLARYASDRGDAARGLALLRRAGTPSDHELVELLEHFQAMPRSDLSRNQPCWCGSGRKYKKCHLHHEQLPLDERAAWLYQKAGIFLLDGSWRIAVIEAAGVRAQFAEAPHAVLGALNDPLVTDVVLFEGGAFAEFVATRGGLLPEDERLLAEQWLLIDRSVYEIERVRRGVGFTMRDVRTGDVHQVRERTASQAVKAGALVCARVVPAGDTTQIFGGLEPVALHERDELIALLDSGPDPLDLIALLTRRFAPPAGEVSALDPADPELTAVLEELIRDYEQKWLDEPIPALAGHTPRQAAADPTRRDDLIRLIDHFPSHHDNPGTMNPDRLRTALNLW
jgi:tetratricopeptide (TPR) repeat protein